MVQMRCCWPTHKQIKVPTDKPSPRHMLPAVHEYTLRCTALTQSMFHPLLFYPTYQQPCFERLQIALVVDLQKSIHRHIWCCFWTLTPACIQLLSLLDSPFFIELMCLSTLHSVILPPSPSSSLSFCCGACYVLVDTKVTRVERGS